MSSTTAVTGAEPSETFNFWFFGTDTNPLNQAVAEELTRRGIRTTPISGVYYDDAARLVLQQNEKPPDLLIFGDDSNRLSWLHGTAKHVREQCRRAKCVVILAKPTHPLPHPLRGYAETQRIFTHRNAIQETVDWIVRTFIEMVRGA